MKNDADDWAFLDSKKVNNIDINRIIFTIINGAYTDVINSVSATKKQFAIMVDSVPNCSRLDYLLRYAYHSPLQQIC